MRPSMFREDFIGEAAELGNCFLCPGVVARHAFDEIDQAE
jgi:hypothetical protein